MLKNISAKGIVVILAFLFVSNFFVPGVKSANAAAGPAILALSLIAGSLVSYAGSNKPGGYYTYRNKPDPAPIKSGPHFIQRFDTHFLVDTRNQVWIGDNNSGQWLLMKAWEERNRKKVTREDLNIRSCP